MQIEHAQNPQQGLKPKNILLLQQTILQSRVFPVFSLNHAIQKMIQIYGEAMTLQNIGNAQTQNTVRFSLQSMTEYYESMENIMYMQKDDSSSQKSKDKHKTQLQSYDKDYVIASMKGYCTKKSNQESVKLAKNIFEKGQDVKETLKNMGFAV